MVPRVQRLNLHWSRQVNHSFRYKSRIRPFPYFSSPNSFFQSTLSTSSINKAETIQFTSLHHKIRTVLSNSTAPLPPLPPTLSSPPSSSSSSSSPSKAIKSTVQSRAYSPQQFYKNRILDQYVSQPVNTITLRQLVVFGRNLTEDRLLKSGNYVRTELPIRLAHRIRDFQNLPFIVGTNPHIAMVYDLYWSAFEKLRKFPTITNLDENDEYCDTVKGLLKEHLVVIPQLALGISECSQHLHPDQLDRFMNTMLRSRISRRVLAEQQIALTENWNDPGYVYGQDGHDGYIGIVSTQCKSGEIVQRCANMTRNVCRTIYNVEPPQVLVDGHVDTTFAYIPDHIEYMLYELLNNSIRGVMLKFSPSLKHVSEPPELLQQFQKLERLKSPDISKDPSSIYPPISVTISSGPTDLYFRISDQGGGISDEIYPHIWSFASTPTLNNKFENFVKVPQMAAKVQEYEQSIIPPTLHLGIGLPMSKVYAEYWGGGLTLFTMDGYGTDAYVKISRLGNREENLE